MKAEIRIQAGQKFPQRKFRKFEQEKKWMWTAVLPEKQASSAVKRARKMGFSACTYEEKYDRDATYRQKFLRKNPPRNGYYRCVYCGRFVREKDMEVDHVIPVQKAKYTGKAKQLLAGKNVNNLSNLVASCHRCNMKKGASLKKKWRRRAKLGRHDAYWVLRGVLYALLLFTVVLVVAIISQQDFDSLDEAARTFIRQAAETFPGA